MITNRDFGQNLKVQMTKAKVSGLELAKEVSVSPVTISRYRSGSRRPDIRMLKRIQAVLECEIGDLI